MDKYLKNKIGILKGGLTLTPIKISFFNEFLEFSETRSVHFRKFAVSDVYNLQGRMKKRPNELTLDVKKFLIKVDKTFIACRSLDIMIIKPDFKQIFHFQDNKSALTYWTAVATHFNKYDL